MAEQDLFQPNQEPLPWTLGRVIEQMYSHSAAPYREAQQSLLDALSDVLTQQHQTAFGSPGWQSFREEATALTKTLDALQARLEAQAQPHERGPQQGMDY